MSNQPPTAPIGCFDGSCIWLRPRGMTTNGGCNCEKDLRQALRDIGYTPSQSIAFTSAIRLVRNAIESGREQAERAALEGK